MPTAQPKRVKVLRCESGCQERPNALDSNNVCQRSFVFTTAQGRSSKRSSSLAHNALNRAEGVRFQSNGGDVVTVSGGITPCSANTQRSEANVPAVSQQSARNRTSLAHSSPPTSIRKDSHNTLPQANENGGELVVYRRSLADTSTQPHHTSATTSCSSAVLSCLTGPTCESKPSAGSAARAVKSHHLVTPSRKGATGGPSLPMPLVAISAFARQHLNNVTNFTKRKFAAGVHTGFSSVTSPALITLTPTTTEDLRAAQPIGEDSDFPSECSSLNSSFSERPPTSMNEARLHVLASMDSGVADFSPHVPVTQDLAVDGDTSFDEEDEEKAVQCYMGTGMEPHEVPEEGENGSGMFVEEGATGGWSLKAAKEVTKPSATGAPQSCGSCLSTSVPSSTVAITSNLVSSNGAHKPVTAVDFAVDLFQQLSVYDAFFVDKAKNVWLVDDNVLARCLQYVCLMGYEHPQLRLDLAMGTSSMWARSTSIPSPIMRNIEAAAPTIPNRADRPWSLRAPPVCAASLTGTRTHFLSRSEAMRWVMAREYVIGTILMCCATDNASASHNKHPEANEAALPSERPVIPVSVHPILWMAQLVSHVFPDWGGAEIFGRVWEIQVKLVLGSASPSHQKVFQFPADRVTFSSDCEAGNLVRVEQSSSVPYFFHLWLEPDLGCDKRIWFRFDVNGCKEGRLLRLRLLNAAPHTKLYRQNGMRPVWRDGVTVPHWVPVAQCSFCTSNGDQDGELSFSIYPRSSTATINVAFCVPYTYADLLCHLCNWHSIVQYTLPDTYFDERVMCLTPDGRKAHLLTITSMTSLTVPAGGGRRHRRRRSGGVRGASRVTTEPDIRGPYANFETGKKVVLISGRVHPGEVTASHGLHGAISFLLSADPRAAHLRQHFIFVVVPMLNPDGVSRGHSRLDQYGINLNRCYNHPDPHSQPTVHALRNIFEQLRHTYRERFFLYLDFHSHASQSSGFVFGNCLPIEVQHWNMILPKIIELHAKDVFSFSLCRFGKGHMTSKDGASRVLFGGSLIHSYTVELTHFTNHELYADTPSSVGRVGGSRTVQDVLSAQHPRRYLMEAHDAEGDKSSRNRYAHRTPFLRKGSLAAMAVATPTRQRRSLSEAACCRPRRSLSLPPTEAVLTRKKRSVSLRKRSADVLPLQPITTPSVLCQSAEVGKACMLALLDYCDIEPRPSVDFVVYGGMDRLLLEAKRQTKKSSTRKSDSQPLRSMFKGT